MTILPTGIKAERDGLYRLSADQSAGDQVALAIEVAATAFRRVPDLKTVRCSQNGAQELWIVEVRRRTVEIHRGPGAEGYRPVAVLDEAEPFSPSFLPDETLWGSDSLPPP